MAEAPSGAAQAGVAAVLPPYTKTVYIEHKLRNGKTVSGDFTFRRLTVANTARVGAEISRLNGGLPVDTTTSMINTMLAHFKFCIVKSPEWWDVEELYDVSLLQEVFEAVMTFEETFRPAQKSGGQAPSPTGEEAP